MTEKSETPRDLRKKLSRITTSRDLLKDNLRETQYQVKILKNCLSAMTTSREKWQAKYKENKILAENLQQELSNITQNRDELIAKLENSYSSELKKNNC